MKRIVAFLLVFVFAMSFSVVVAASTLQDGMPEETGYTGNEGNGSRDLVLPPHLKDDPPGSGNVGILTIFSSNDGGSSSSNTSGHAFLSFSNTSSSSVVVGGLTVAPGEEITFGTWGNKSAHVGIWYNLESYFIHSQGAYDNRVSLSVGITQSSVNSINTIMEDYDTWGVLNNCASFAIRVWNAVCSTTLSAGTIDNPTDLMTSIRSNSGYQTARTVQENANVGYVSNGVFVPVSVATALAANTMNPLGEGVALDNYNPNSFS